MTIPLADVVVLGLTSYAVTYTALDAAVPVIALPRRWLQAQFESRAAASTTRAESSSGSGRRLANARTIFWDSLHTLSGCSWCFSFWATMFVTLYWCHYVHPLGGLARAVVFDLAAWVVTGVLASIVDFVSTATHTLDDVQNQLDSSSTEG